jgi:hypothetical protein
MPSFNQSRSGESIQKKCRRLVAAEQKYLEIRKRFVSTISEIENSLDTTPADEESNGGDTKRRRKSIAYDICEAVVLSPEEVREDLNAINEVDEINVYIEDGVLFVQSERFVKGDRIKVRLHGEEAYGSIGSVRDDDIVVKTKDYKRLVVSLDDMVSGKTTVRKIGSKEVYR